MYPSNIIWTFGYTFIHLHYTLSIVDTALVLCYLLMWQMDHKCLLFYVPHAGILNVGILNLDRSVRINFVAINYYHMV